MHTCIHTLAWRRGGRGGLGSHVMLDVYTDKVIYLTFIYIYIHTYICICTSTMITIKLIILIIAILT